MNYNQENFTEKQYQQRRHEIQELYSISEALQKYLYARDLAYLKGEVLFEHPLKDKLDKAGPQKVEEAYQSLIASLQDTKDIATMYQDYKTNDTREKVEIKILSKKLQEYLLSADHYQDPQTVTIFQKAGREKTEKALNLFLTEDNGLIPEIKNFCKEAYNRHQKDIFPELTEPQKENPEIKAANDKLEIQKLANCMLSYLSSKKVLKGIIGDVFENEMRDKKEMLEKADLTKLEAAYKVIINEMPDEKAKIAFTNIYNEYIGERKGELQPQNTPTKETHSQEFSEEQVTQIKMEEKNKIEKLVESMEEEQEKKIEIYELSMDLSGYLMLRSMPHYPQQLQVMSDNEKKYIEKLSLAGPEKVEKAYQFMMEKLDNEQVKQTFVEVYARDKAIIFPNSQQNVNTNTIEQQPLPPKQQATQAELLYEKLWEKDKTPDGRIERYNGPNNLDQMCRRLSQTNPELASQIQEDFNRRWKLKGPKPSMEQLNEIAKNILQKHKDTFLPYTESILKDRKYYDLALGGNVMNKFMNICEVMKKEDPDSCQKVMATFNQHFLTNTEKKPDEVAQFVMLHAKDCKDIMQKYAEKIYPQEMSLIANKDNQKQNPQVSKETQAYFSRKIEK